MDERAVPRLTLPDETGLFCIDADMTIIDGHTHNTIWDAVEKNRGILVDSEAQWDLVKHFHPLGGNPQAWHDLFHTLINDGHSVAIVSFSSFGENILPRYLHNVIGLDKDFIAQHICIISRLPKNQTTKDGHILEAKEKTGRTNLPPQKIVLCDDKDELVWDAIRRKYAGVFATSNAEHIQVLLERSKKLKLPKEPTPYASPRSQSLSDTPPSPRIFSSAANVLRSSPSRAAMGRSGTPECGLQSSGEYSSDNLQSSFEGVKII